VSLPTRVVCKNGRRRARSGRWSQIAGFGPEIAVSGPMWPWRPAAGAGDLSAWAATSVPILGSESAAGV